MTNKDLAIEIVGRHIVEEHLQTSLLIRNAIVEALDKKDTQIKDLEERNIRLQEQLAEYKLLWALNHDLEAAVRILVEALKNIKSEHEGVFKDNFIKHLEYCPDCTTIHEALNHPTIKHILSNPSQGAE